MKITGTGFGSRWLQSVASSIYSSKRTTVWTWKFENHARRIRKRGAIWLLEAINMMPLCLSIWSCLNTLGTPFWAWSRLANGKPTPGQDKPTKAHFFGRGRHLSPALGFESRRARPLRPILKRKATRKDSLPEFMDFQLFGKTTRVAN